MSFQAMPFLFLNMGGEMAYILEQRLQAQNVGDEKSGKVLCDILQVMLSKSFLDELFEPQEMMSRQALRQFFEQIAHSSVMRLNEASMDKLFDLMVMAAKHQFLLCKEPSELVLVTLNHLDGMKAIFKAHPQVLEHIDHANTLLMDHFGDTPLWQMAAIRSELLNFMHGSRVKVSLMLRERRQLDDGRFVLFPEGEQIELPYNSVMPGSVRYVENGALVRSEQFPVDERFKIYPDRGFHQDRAMVRGTKLGQNMYNCGREGAQQDQQTAAGQGKASRGNGPARATGEELELLSLLIKGDGTQGAEGFELTLFEGEETGNKQEGKEKAGQKKKKEGAETKANPGKRDALSQAVKEMSLDKGEESGAAKPVSRKGSRKGKDLLEMMDQEAKGPTKKAELVRKRSGSTKRTPAK